MMSLVEVSENILDAELANGCRVVIGLEEACPVVALDMKVAVGSCADPLGKAGLAHLCEHLMFTAHGTSTSSNYFEVLCGLGVPCTNASTERDNTSFSSTLLLSGLSSLLRVEVDRLQHPMNRLSQDLMDSEVQIIHNESASAHASNPSFALSEGLFKTIFPPDHPYAAPILGTRESRARIELGDIRSFTEQNYTSGALTFVVWGALDDQKALADTLFLLADSIPSGPKVSRLSRRVCEPMRSGTEGQITTASGPHFLQLGWLSAPVHTTGDAVADLCASILGWGPESRLKGPRLNTSCPPFQGASCQHSMREISVFTVSCAYRDLVDDGLARRWLLDEIGHLASYGPEDAELCSSKARIRASLLRAMQNPSFRADFIARQSFPLTANYLERELDRYETVTALDIKAFCEQLLRTEPAVVHGRH